MKHITGHRIKTNRIELQVREQEGAGEALLLLHFGGANMMVWQRALPHFRDGYRPILVDMGKCKHCGTCATACFVDAIALNNGSVLHDHDRCIGCRRCTTACPEGAVRLELDDPEAAIEELMGRIRRRANVE